MANGFELISDLYKDAYGFRPTAAYLEQFQDSAESDKEQEWDSLCKYMAMRQDEEEAMEADAFKTFTDRIAGMMADYNISEGTAIRWDMESFDVDIDGALDSHGSAIQEIEFFLYKQGLIAQKYTSVLIQKITSELRLNQYGA